MQSPSSQFLDRLHAKAKVPVPILMNGGRGIQAESSSFDASGMIPVTPH
jgi:hypothetical protein